MLKIVLLSSESDQYSSAPKEISKFPLLYMTGYFCRSVYIYTKEKEVPASEAGIKPYWRSENRECKDRVTTMNDFPVGETGHNLHAPSPQEAEV